MVLNKINLTMHELTILLTHCSNSIIEGCLPSAETGKLVRVARMIDKAKYRAIHVGRD